MSIHKSKWKISPLSTAISFALGITPFAFAEDTETSSRAIEEVLVTARKRSESIMDIPASVQALTGDDLKEMGARGLSDYSRFMPVLRFWIMVPAAPPWFSEVLQLALDM
jgi:outer membrane receptor protein involved in Fe transport